MKRRLDLRMLININAYPVNVVLELLLKDKSTKKNIIFATDAYRESYSEIDARTQITKGILLGFDAYTLQPRVSKSLEEQVERTRKKAEVFTPSWICNKMNNHCDEVWFDRKDVFNTEMENGWIVTTAKVEFPIGKDWKSYVDSKRLEITCGEAPYIVSRYDASTGEYIEPINRIGILDRKLRIVNENTTTKHEWNEWVIRAYQSVYGYEFQGDNLLIARINLLETYVDYMQDRWNEKPTEAELKKMANIISWNLWQMDGITGSIPFGKPHQEYVQMSFFDFIDVPSIDDKEDKPEEIDCRIYDWRSKQSVTYKSIKEGK